MLEWIDGLWPAATTLGQSLPNWKICLCIGCAICPKIWRQEQYPGRRTRDTSHESSGQSDY